MQTGLGLGIGLVLGLGLGLDCRPFGMADTNHGMQYTGFM